METYFQRCLSETPFEENEDKKYEFCRLISFNKWPESSPVFPIRLAQAGFFYLGPEDKVQCYKCEITKSDWKVGDKPREIHTELNKDCPFLVCGEDNIPINDTELYDLTEENPPPASNQENTEQGEELNSENPDQNRNSLGQGSENKESESLTSAGENTASPLDTLQGITVTSIGPSRSATSSKNSCTSTVVVSCASSDLLELPASVTISLDDQDRNTSAQVYNTSSASSKSSSTSATVTVSSCSVEARSSARRSNSPQISVEAQSVRTSASVADSRRIPESMRNTPSPTLPSSRLQGSARHSPLSGTHPGTMNRGRDIPPPSGDSIGPLRFERNRLETFKNWPCTAKVSAADLARCGFYYTGSGDRAQCIFCKGILRNWEEGDRPHIEHRKHFPRCPLVLGMNIGNVPLPLDQNPAAATLQIQPRPQILNVADALANMEALGINTDRPKNPQYAIESTRLASYQNWPSYKHQTPQQLAEAGFFYAGFSDNVKCFYCDGGLRNWERGDEPWQEHARWFQRCPFVIQVKGQDFINTLTQNNQSDVPLLVQSQIGGPAQPNRVQLVPGGGRRHHVEEREVRARMDLPMIQLALDMNISRDILMAVVRKRLEETGDDFPNATSLLEAVFEYKETSSIPQNTPQLSPGTISGRAGVDEFIRKIESPNTPVSLTTAIENGETMETGQTNSRPLEPGTQQKPEDKHEGSDSTELKKSPSVLEATELLKENMELKEQRLCKICMVADANVVFLPCAHLVSCAACAPALRQCPICRANIKGTIRTYLS